MFNKVVIAGVGLIGGSLGLALTQHSLAREIIGVDPDADNLDRAVQLGAIHRGEILAHALSRAELFILAAPIGLTLGILEMSVPYLETGSIVTDVGSVKGRLVERAEAMLPPDIHFVGAHPMAGLEVSGVAGARKDLFEGATYVLTPTEKTNPAAIDKLKLLFRTIGSITLEMDPMEHDRAVAMISHLPHLLAAALVNTTASDPSQEQLLKLAGGGFRDTTRIAASNPAMWRDILLTNREMVLESIQKFRLQLEAMERAIAEFNSAGLVNSLGQAGEVRKGLPETRKYVRS